ncbi:unnamed protein product, partial [Brassica oleracea var. botrytis]
LTLCFHRTYPKQSTSILFQRYLLARAYVHCTPRLLKKISLKTIQIYIISDLWSKKINRIIIYLQYKICTEHLNGLRWPDTYKRFQYHTYRLLFFFFNKTGLFQPKGSTNLLESLPAKDKPGSSTGELDVHTA